MKTTRYGSVSHAIRTEPSASPASSAVKKLFYRGRRGRRWFLLPRKTGQGGHNSLRPLALLGVLVIAKLAMIAGRPIQISGWSPIAYFWQDILVALAFAILDYSFAQIGTGRVPAWVLYGAVVFYVAINVPVARVLSSPLTWPMIGATRGALSDSIAHHATAINLSLIALVVVSGVVLPIFLRPMMQRVRRRSPGFAVLILAALVLVAIGPMANSRIDTVGMGRNAVTALASTALPRIAASTGGGSAETWRISSFAPDGRAEDLSRLRGAASGRNVVVIVLESTGAQYLKTFGASADPTPTLSAMADSSVVFDNAYSVYPESIKGLFATLCSRYPAMDTDAESYARITTPSIAGALQQSGYRTALFHSGRFMYLGMEAVVENRGFDILEDAGAIGGNRESSFGVDEPSTVSRALNWIDSLDRDDRFFLTYLPIAGHHPYDTPEPGPFTEITESDRYLNALHYADESLGALVKGIRERGLKGRTLFVIFGDHGEAFGQHEGNFGHSLFLYDENVRVPFLIAAPGLIKEQMRVTRPISLIDAAPTIFDLLGSQPPAGWQGLTALNGNSNAALFYTDYSLSLMGLRDGCWKFVYEVESGRSKLFDVCADTGEATDLSSFHRDRVSAYRAQVSKWASAQKGLLKGTNSQ